jgi:hypothetical protein
MLRCVTLVRTDVLEERVASNIRVKGISLLWTLAVTINRSMLLVDSFHLYGRGDKFL